MRFTIEWTGETLTFAYLCEFNVVFKKDVAMEYYGLEVCAKLIRKTVEPKDYDEQPNEVIILENYSPAWCMILVLALI